MSSRNTHRLFKKYPLDGQVTINGQQVTTPYHIYDGQIMFIGGTAKADVAQELLKNERLAPILDTNGDALMALWVCDFTEANLGAHHELQISIFASVEPQAPVKAHPFAIFRLLVMNPDAMMVCHGLWNNTPLVVDYNREHLGLDAGLSISTISTTDHRRVFDIQDATSKQPIVRGNLAEPIKADNKALRGMVGHMGFGGMMRAMRSPFIHVPVVNTISAVSNDNRVAHTYTKNDKQIVRYFEPTHDKLTIHHPHYVPLAFQPAFVQHSYGIRFVYLRPETILK
ncbi:MAG: hypothetical protein SFZ02_04355 [bacterium]|nr:hypothetical protein [bacterium]